MLLKPPTLLNESPEVHCSLAAGVNRRAGILWQPSSLPHSLCSSPLPTALGQLLLTLALQLKITTTTTSAETFQDPHQYTQLALAKFSLSAAGSLQRSPWPLLCAGLHRRHDWGTGHRALRDTQAHHTPLGPAFSSHTAPWCTRSSAVPLFRF